MGEKKSKFNVHLRFSLLLMISFPLTILLLYFLTYPITPLSKESHEKISKTTNISIPSYSFSEFNTDTNLFKFPSDYDSLVNTLGISLTQHQKATLLLYGESISKTEYTNITDAYLKLLELDIPILIPAEYINEYVEKEIYKINTEGNIPDLKLPLSIKRDSFNTNYAEYIYNQMLIQLQQEPLTHEGKERIERVPISDFQIVFDQDSFNNGYYKIQLLKELNKDTKKLENLYTKLLSHSKSVDTNKESISSYLIPIITNDKLNIQGEVYWKISVYNGKSYVHPIYLVQEYSLNDSNFSEEYDLEPLQQSSKTTRVPILMYHQIDPIPQGSPFVQGLYVTPEIFEQQLAYLVKKNYKSITPEELYALLKSKQNPLQKSVMITFDDSKSSQYRNAYPLLKKYGLTGIFYVISNRTGITYTQLREMSENGMIMGSHTSTHIDLTKETNSEKLYSEIVGSRDVLRDSFNQNISSIAYPGCVIDTKGYPFVNQAGYLIGVSCGKSIDHTLNKRLSLSRVHVSNSLENLINLLSGIY